MDWITTETRNNIVDLIKRKKRRKKRKKNIKMYLTLLINLKQKIMSIGEHRK